MPDHDAADGMTPKERAECLIALQAAQMAHLQQTRELEFKVNVALWTTIGLAGYFLVGKIELNSLRSATTYGIAAMAIYLAHIVLWMMPIQNSCDQDAHYIREYRRGVEKLAAFELEEFQPHYEWQARLRAKGWLWVLGETGLTLVLLLAVGLLLAI